MNKALSFRPTDDILKRIAAYRADIVKANGGVPTTMTSILLSLLGRQLTALGYSAEDNT